MIDYPQSFLMHRFSKNSCYIFSLARAAEMLTNRAIDASTVLKIALDSKHISSDAYVYDAEAFLGQLVPSSRFTVEKAGAEAIDYSSGALIPIRHWVYSPASSPDGPAYTAHHFNLIDWDPLSYECQAVKLGSILDYRLVRFL